MIMLPTRRQARATTPRVIKRGLLLLAAPVAGTAMSSAAGFSGVVLSGLAIGLSRLFMLESLEVSSATTVTVTVEAVDVAGAGVRFVVVMAGETVGFGAETVGVWVGLVVEVEVW